MNVSVSEVETLPLHVRVAFRVFGWERVWQFGEEWWGVRSINAHEAAQPVPRWDLDMSLAWPIVERVATLMGYDHVGYEWQGPVFKPEHYYLTQENYGLGTTCWYIYLVLDGERSFIASDHPAQAVCEAALKVATAFKLWERNNDTSSPEPDPIG